MPLPNDPAPSSLSFVAALAVFDMLAEQVGAGSLMLKWPNDILADGAKICGILLESVSGHVIVGIGVNIATAPDLPDRKTACVRDFSDDLRWDAATAIAQLAHQFDYWRTAWREQGLAHILAEWQARAHPEDSLLRVTGADGQKREGRYAGLASDGALRLRLADGSLTTIYAGDVETA